MALPFFFAENLAESASLALDEITSKHIAQVLRMKAGEKIQLTNGTGLVATAEIVTSNKKGSTVALIDSLQQAHKTKRITGIAISPVKNNSRFEWFLEKATELGVSDIYPLLCTRTEREHFRYERMNAISISAMLQSQQAWLPVLHQPILFHTLISGKSEQALHLDTYHHKWIAHCAGDEKQSLADALTEQMEDGLILIGPEGDFTQEEVNLALDNGFKPVGLGNTRLRTETAGITAASLLLLA
jgi:16S rRNA (uracil1498-N3)-methyltransferase